MDTLRLVLGLLRARTAGVYTDEKLLPLATEFVSVPAIPKLQPATSPAALPAEADVQAIVAGLTCLRRPDGRYRSRIRGRSCLQAIG